MVPARHYGGDVLFAERDLRVAVIGAGPQLFGWIRDLPIGEVELGRDKCEKGVIGAAPSSVAA